MPPGAPRRGRSAGEGWRYARLQAQPPMASTMQPMAAQCIGVSCSPSTTSPASAATAGALLTRSPKTCAGTRRSAAISSE